jgi:hypothetical protein
MIKATKQESTFELVPIGNHLARVYRVIHIGTAPEAYMGEEQMMNKILIGFELCNEKKVFKEEKGEEPLVIGREFTLSMGKKSNLKKFVENMLGVALQDEEAYSFDIASLIGEACLLNVIHKVSGKGNTYALIQGASPVPKGMIVPAQHNPAQKLDYEKFDEELYKSLPEYIRTKIGKTEEFKKMRGFVDKSIEEIDSEDVPF